MRLSVLLEQLDYELVRGNVDTEITTLVYDSRKVEEGSVFVCITGTVSDGHSYIPDVISKGAVAIIVSRDIEVPGDVTVVKVSDERLSLAMMSAAYFDYPAKKLTTIGITGTKGKTTSAFMVYEILNLSGIKTGLIGTIETIIGDCHIPSSHSTPESFVVQQRFREMVVAGLEAVVMEVSSQGLKMKRVGGINFDIGVFTNLSPDHIGGNEHPDFEDYLYCKSQLFKQCKVGLGNADDSHFEEIMNDHSCELYTFGTGEKCDFRGEDIELTAGRDKEGTGSTSAGVSFKVTGKQAAELYIDIPGRFMVYNALTAFAICNQLGVPTDCAVEALSHVKVRGRVETVPVSDRFTIMVDYAHNEMSLRSVLHTLREYNPGRLICVFGCGGNRSKDRRYTMGQASGELSDLTIITSDNPRFEEPAEIIKDIIVGINRAPKAVYEVVEDRYEAIKFALENAKEGDLILVAGKGHEDYQEIKGVKYHMDDRELILRAAGELGL